MRGRKKKASVLIALLLSICMTVPTFAADVPDTGVQENVVTDEGTNVEEETGIDNVENSVPEEGKESEEPPVVEENVEQQENQDAIVTEENLAVEEPAAQGEGLITAAVEADTWTSADFTYTEMSKKLYGCDYSREFTVSGLAVSGFSESGLEKIKTNKELVIPAEDPNGTKIMGVTAGAFKDQGLTKLTLPEGAIIPYDDTVTHVVTERGNFIIGDSAFANNNLTELTLPDGVIAVLTQAFQNNKLETVSIPHTVWWLENSSFARNNLKTVGFPQSTDFQCEIHAFAFAHNEIKSVRLPDYTLVVEKKVFYWNPGMENVPSKAPSGEEEYGGVVYMYTDNPNLANVERIHHIDKKAESQLSWHQKLIVGDKPEVDNSWKLEDFTFSGTAVTGLSESGLKKSQNDKELVIPEKTSGGEVVTKVVGEFAAQGDPFNRIILHNNITEIGSDAFAGCPITSLNLPANLKKIGVGAFKGNRLSTLNIPGTVEVIEENAFSQAESKLTELSMGEGVAEIQANAFENSLLEKVNLPDSLKKLSADAFKRAEGEKIRLYTNNENHVSDKDNFPESKYHIVKINLGDWSVSDFTFDKENPTVITGLTEQGYLKRQDNRNLVLPDKNADGDWVTELKSAAATEGGLFGSADPTDETKTVYTFDTVKLPARIEKIGQFVFDANRIKKINFPDTLKEIGTGAFRINDLEEIMLPDSVITLGESAFVSNEKVRKIRLSENMTKIPRSAFGNAAYVSAPYTELDIPNSVTEIDSNAFAGNHLKKLEIPASVEKVADSAFMNTSVTQTLEELILHEGLKELGSKCFAYSRLKTVYIPSTLESLNPNTFYEGTEGKVVAYVDGMEQYELFTKKASQYHEVKITPGPWDVDDFTYDGTVLTGFSEKGMLKREDKRDLILPDKTPEGKVITGIAATTMGAQGLFGKADKNGNTCTFNTLKLPSQLEEIGAFAFEANGLTEVTFPNTLKKIGQMAFRNNLLLEVILPDSVTTLEMGAFTAAKATIEKIVLSKALTEIPQAAFSCVDPDANAPYTEVIIPDGVTSIGRSAFSGNSLIKVEIPASVTLIDQMAFFNGPGHESIQEVILHESTVKEKGLKTIKQKAFGGGAITNIDIPRSVTTIEPSAFAANRVNKNNFTVILWSNDKKGQENINNQTKNTFVIRFKADEFTFEETTLTGLTEEGLTAMAEAKTLVLPRTNEKGEVITEIGDAEPNTGGVFGAALTRSSETTVFEKVVLPSEIKKIGKFAFQNNGIKEIEFPETLEEIGQNAFHNNHIASVILPDSVTTLGTCAFMENPEIKEIRISPNIETISVSAFNVAGAGAIGLQTLEIPEGVKKIDNAAFGGNHIKALVLPESVEEIGRSAFMQTESGRALETLTLSSNLKIIERQAFANSKLKYVIMPGKVETLAKTAFTNGENKVWLYTQNPKQLIETSDFKPIGANHQVLYEEALSKGWSMDDFTYEGKTITGWSDKGNKTRKGNLNLVLPTVNPSTGEAITAIGDKAFAIPEGEWDQGHTGVESINGMDTVVIPKTVTSIGAQAFQYNNLVKVDFPDVLTSIGENAFNSNKMTEVSLPDSVTQLSGGAFSANNITSIKLSRGLTKLESGVFSDNIRLTGVEIPDTITEIGDFAFSGDRLETLTIPKSVTKIGRAAFKLHHLTELTIPGNVKEIGDSAFEGTYKAITLKKLTLNEGVESIGALAFRMGYLQNVTLPNSLRSLDVTAFKDNTGENESNIVTCHTSNLEHLKFPASDYHKMVFKVVWTGDCFTYEGTTVTGLSDKGKEYLNYTTELVIPDKNPESQYITAIAARAFMGYGLTKVMLPAKLERIGEEAFAENNLTSVEIPNTIQEIASNAFRDNEQTVELITGSKEVYDKLSQNQYEGAEVREYKEPLIPENTSGSGTTNPNDAGKVNTGDTTPIFPFASAAVVSLAVIAIVLKKRKNIGRR